MQHTVSQFCARFFVVGVQQLIACLPLFSSCAAGSFVTVPENVTVYSGQMAMFTCKVTQSGQEGLYWLITEQRLQPIQLQDIYKAIAWDPEAIDDPDTSSIALQMVGVSETNNTSVECIGYFPNPEYIISDKVYLRVQGILYAPSNLASSVMNDSVLITWNPPSTLPGTTMMFAITINASVRDHSETFATSQHNFLIGICDLSVSACNSNCELSVSVRSINQVGEGEPASITVPIQPFLCDGAEYDRPGPPTDLVANAMDDSLSVSWSRPSSSHAISHYSVNVRDTQTEFLIANGIETFDLQYTLEYMTVGIDTCNKSYDIAIFVYAVNIAGKGETANATLVIQQLCASTTVTEIEIITTPVIFWTTQSPQEDSEDRFILLATGASVIMLIVAGAVIALIIRTIYIFKRIHTIDVKSSSIIENPSFRDVGPPPLTNNPSNRDAGPPPLTKNPSNRDARPPPLTKNPSYGDARPPPLTKNPSNRDARPPPLTKNSSYGDARPPPLTKNPCYEEPPHLYESINPSYSTAAYNFNYEVV